MEALALAGSFDTIGDTHRAQFFVESDNTIFLEKLMRYASNYQAEKDSIQISLFDDIEEESQDFGLNFPQCEPWTSLQKLNKEREVTGFYISGHPLDDYRLEINSFSKYTFADLEEPGMLKRMCNYSFNLIGMIMDASTGIGKNGQAYGKIVMEDYHGKRDFSLWGETFMKFGHLCKPYILVMLTVKSELRYGRDGKSDDDYQLKITDMQLLENVMEERTRRIMVSLSNHLLDEELICSLEKLIDKHRSKKGVLLCFRVLDLEQSISIHLAHKEKVEAVPFCQELRKLVNDEAILLEDK
jgi:DNA polymerase-3 subunit alpha